MRLTVIEIKANNDRRGYRSDDLITVDITATSGATTLIYQSTVKDAPTIGDHILISPIKEQTT
jgi:hypothetical protein